MSPSEQYPAPIDTLLPQSTAQVMRPVERFIEQRTDPVEIALDSPPTGWSVLHEDTFGQLETAIFLGEHLGEAARASAHGWAGDRYMLVTDPTGAEVLHWLSVWETEAEATRFADTVRRASERRATRRITVTREDVDGMAVVRITDAAAAAAATPAWQPAYRLGHTNAR
jgi:hypothetical protein